MAAKSVQRSPHFSLHHPLNPTTSAKKNTAFAQLTKPIINLQSKPTKPIYLHPPSNLHRTRSLTGPSATSTLMYTALPRSSNHAAHQTRCEKTTSKSPKLTFLLLSFQTHHIHTILLNVGFPCFCPYHGRRCQVR